MSENLLIKEGGNVSITRTFLAGSFFTFGTYAVAQLLRFVTNIILARLLFPEAFGIMALMNTFLQGLIMFSDFGLGISIIQHDRGDEDDFLQTAWTVQILRSLFLWGVACAITWPVARFYGQQQLLILFPVCAFNLVINGFVSVSVYTENRHLRMFKINMLDLLAQFGGAVVMIIWALLAPSVWALLLGGLCAAFIKLGLSYVMLPAFRPRLGWDREAVHDLVHFGKWLFFSSIFGFLASRGDGLILGKFLSMRMFGLYGFATMMANAPVMGLQAVSDKVLFPLYSRLRQIDEKELRLRAVKIRSVIMLAGLPILAGLIVFGQDIVNLVYDHRYREVGWILQLVSVGAAASIVSMTLSPVLLASGNSRRFMFVLMLKTFFFMGGMLAGGLIGVHYWQDSFLGVLSGIVAARYVSYVAVYVATKRYDVCNWKLDAAAFCAFAGMIWVGVLVRGWLFAWLFPEW